MRKLRHRQVKKLLEVRHRDAVSSPYTGMALSLSRKPMSGTLRLRPPCWVRHV